MNVVDYLFENTKDFEKKLILGRYENISYSDIYKQIVKISNYLKGLKLKNSNIGLISENSVFFIVSYFGIMKSGNIAVPLSTKIEENELSKIIKLCSIEHFFIQDKFIELLNGQKLEIIKDTNINDVLTKNEMEIKKHNVSEMPETPDDSTAAIIFTSGSTGASKGVVLSHKNIISNTYSIIQYLKITKNDIQLVVLPFYYCFGTSLLHTHIKSGASLVLNNQFILTQTIIDDLIKYKCTSFSGVPSHYQILLRKSKFKETSFPDLRYLTQAGGKLENMFIKEIRKSHPEIAFIIMYGQTEATARLSYLPFEKLDEKLGSIGKGIPNVKLEVLKNGKSVKPDEVGEIVASGDNIMEGYFMDPGETQKVIKNKRLYTGDLAVVDEEGYIYIHSREKHIIKSAGNRVSPKEIESVICEMPEVVNCAVIGVFDELLGEVPKAIVVLKKKGLLTESDIKNYCRKHLQPYKVPKDIQFIDKMPLNSSEKIDMNQLIERYKNAS
jgi:acyl-CoA synthetase (AMP-forming)/AMP-acid ligase II